MRVNLTKKEIINSVFMQIGFSKKMSESILEDILSDIVKNLKKYKVVKISNFGTFHIRFKKSRVGRNPKTKEEKIIKERNVVLFKPSKDFKNFINENNEKKFKTLNFTLQKRINFYFRNMLHINLPLNLLHSIYPEYYYNRSES